MESLSRPLTLIARGWIGDAVKPGAESPRWPPKHEYIDRRTALHNLQCCFEIVEDGAHVGIQVDGKRRNAVLGAQAHARGFVEHRASVPARASSVA